MKSIKERVAILDRKRQVKISDIQNEYREDIKRLYEDCRHDYDNWFTRPHAPIPDTNFRGVPYEHRICKGCGKEETRLVTYEKPRINTRG